MRRLILFVMLAMLVPLGWLAVRVGWPGLIAVVVFTWAVYGMLLLKDAPGKTSMVFFSTAFVLQSLMIAWGLRWTLKQIETALTGSDTIWPIFQLFAGSDLLQNFWAVVGGVVISALLFGLLFSVAAMVRATRLGQPKESSKNGSYSLALRRALGLVPARWSVQNGELVTVKAPKPPQQPKTGPGEINVQRGHAVILEKNGTVSNILPAGLGWIQQDERIAMVVPLYGRADKVVVLNAVTQDGLQIDDLEIMIFHKVSDDGVSDKITDTKSQFSEETLRDKVWSASGSTWEGGVKGVTEREARSVIADYEMEELVTMNGEEREEFKQQLQDKINAVTETFMGVKVTVSGFGTINVPDLAAQKLMASWTAEKDRAMASEQAALEDGIMLNTATARAAAFSTLVGAMNAVLDQRSDVKNLVAMSFVERMERVEGEPMSGVNQDLEALSKLYVVEALKGLTAQPTVPEAAGRAQANSEGGVI